MRTARKTVCTGYKVPRRAVPWEEVRTDARERFRAQADAAKTSQMRTIRSFTRTPELQTTHKNRTKTPEQP